MQPGVATAGGDVAASLITALIVLALVGVFAFLAVRFGGRWLSMTRQRGGHLLDVVAQVPLEPRRSLYVVSVAGKTLLVGTSEMGLSVLSELDSQVVQGAIDQRGAGRSFADLVRSWTNRG